MHEQNLRNAPVFGPDKHSVGGGSFERLFDAAHRIHNRPHEIQKVGRQSFGQLHELYNTSTNAHNGGFLVRGIDAANSRRLFLFHTSLRGVCVLTGAYFRLQETNAIHYAVRGCSIYGKCRLSPDDGRNSFDHKQERQVPPVHAITDRSFHDMSLILWIRMDSAVSISIGVSEGSGEQNTVFCGLLENLQDVTNDLAAALRNKVVLGLCCLHSGCNDYFHNDSDHVYDRTARIQRTS
mmetsp:Transcript_2899/g.7966  ORF Transcript_2899/g.7966 Transcript_2899/m.7966 type:complete len:237 (+) Transcript_2899:360-1070(+)